MSIDPQTVIGSLLTMLAFILWYLFIGLKSEIKSVGKKLDTFQLSTAKLIHKKECFQNVARINTRLDEVDTTLDTLSERVVRVETLISKQ